MHNVIQQALDQSEMKKSDIQEIIMVGGTTQIPKVKELIQSYFFGMEPKRASNPEETNVYGAAIWANAL